MPEHYAIGINQKAGTVEFTGTKVMKVSFDTAFKTKPSVNITLEDGGATHVPYRTKVKTTDFRIVFKTPYTGTVGWEAKEVETNL